jgi:two-component system chemotaxis response regulator CheY
MSGHRILIVDDDPSIRHLLIALLRREEYEMLEASNGLEALAQMRAVRPDLVIMDLVMPLLSGWDVLRERAADPSLLRIPVLVISASNIQNNGDALLAHHVCGVIAKPFELDSILATVERCLRPHVVAPAAA